MNGPRIRALLALTAARTLRPVPLVIGVLLLALPVVFAAVYRGTEGGAATLPEFLVQRYDDLVVSLLLPLAALVTAAGATSAEREDGTVVFLLTTTTSRAMIALVRWGFAVVATSMLVLLSVVSSALVAGAAAAPDALAVMRAFAAGAVAGAAVYSALFLAMALWLRRALLVGLLYVLVWEGTVASLFPAVRYLSARQMLLGITRPLVPEALREATLFAAAPPAAVAGAWAAAVCVVALAASVHRLRRLPVSRPS